ncbi:MAG: 2OG-Fe(II) oxygenase [Gammaproteobacteria bacterium]|nr:2OG-Fe(II) oxygenase [Gammaproteobacteria bacterium]
MVKAAPVHHSPSPGDRIPDFLLSTPSGSVVSLYDKSRGRPILIALAETFGSAAAVCELLGRDDAPRVDAIVVSRSGSGASAPASPASGDNVIHWLYDHDGRATEVFGIGWSEIGVQPRLYLLDENQRLLADLAGGAADGLDALAESLRVRPGDPAASTPAGIAPVLMIPRVFEPEFCRYLIEVFHTRGHEESGVYSLRDGQLRHGVDHDMKKRYDHYVRDGDVTAEISQRLARRVLPEIEKAFCYRVTKLEEFKIACYRAREKGYFRAHRDNYSPQTVHRRFAMTLNLNADDYDGGELRFPEYGPHRYKPATGEAIIFSCSLLHEALDVTDGERYVLLAFLYGEDGARQKAEMARRMEQQGDR